LDGSFLSANFSSCLFLWGARVPCCPRLGTLKQWMTLGQDLSPKVAFSWHTGPKVHSVFCMDGWNVAAYNKSPV
jgi:hypothetical protein